MGARNLVVIMIVQFIHSIAILHIRKCGKSEHTIFAIKLWLRVAKSVNFGGVVSAFVCQDCASMKEEICKHHTLTSECGDLWAITNDVL